MEKDWSRRLLHSVSVGSLRGASHTRHYRPRIKFAIHAIEQRQELDFFSLLAMLEWVSNLNFFAWWINLAQLAKGNSPLIWLLSSFLVGPTADLDMKRARAARVDPPRLG